jgi:ketosteroid isomerase-like protein
VKDIFKPLFLTTCLLTSLALHAQDLESLVNAEKSFAKTSTEKSVRTAFLEFFDRSTVAFTNGQPVLGRKDWERRKESNSYLFWWPVYADIAASGDFGFTTGPAVYGPNRETKEASGGLYYSSVWRKDINGNWKVLADLGSSVYNPNDNLNTFKTSSHQPHPVNDLGAEVKRELIALDKSYNEGLNKAKISFDESYFSDEARVHRRNIAPLTTLQSIENFTETDGFSFDHYEGQVASSNDMAFTYGTVKIITNKDGKEAIEPACYLRVWKVEDGEWSIVLDVID